MDAQKSSSAISNGRENNTSKQQERDEAAWFNLAKGIAGVALILGFLFVVNLFSSQDLGEALTKTKIAYPIAIAIIAGITFCTVVWRGLITTRQADVAADQLAGFQRQLQLQEESRLTELLQKGAEMISETVVSRQSAGIASLSIVAHSMRDEYSITAKNMLIDFIMGKWTDGMTKPPVSTAVQALASAYELSGVVVPRDLKFGEPRSNTGDKNRVDMCFVRGVRSVEYHQGQITGDTFPNDPDTFTLCHQTALHRIDNISSQYGRLLMCEVTASRFLSSPASNFGHNNIGNCNFSGCIIEGDLQYRPSPKPGKNYYYEDTPPSLKSGEDCDWSTFFDVKPVTMRNSRQLARPRNRV